MKWRLWKTAFLLTLGCILLFWMVIPLTPFDDCISKRKNNPAYKALHEKHFLLVHVRIRTRLTFACAVNATDAYQNSIVALSGVMVAFFTGTLWWITRRSVRATEIAAEAARAGIELSRNSFIIENRAYVTPVEFLPSKIIDIHTGRVLSWRFTPQWRNNGSTPAKRVRHLTNGAIFEKAGIPDEFIFPDHERSGPDLTHGRIIGPTFTLPGPYFQIDANIIQTIAKNFGFYIWAWIEYRDVFEDTPVRRTEWCVELVIHGDVTDPKISPEFIFQLESINRFNGADEDCYREAGSQAPVKTVAELAPRSAGLPRLYMTHSFSMPYPNWPQPPTDQ